LIGLLLVAALGGCGADAAIVRRADRAPIAPDAAFVVEPLRFDRLVIEGIEAETWLARRTPGERATFHAGEQLLGDRFRARLEAEPGAIVAQKTASPRTASSTAVVRASVLRLDPGAFYLGGGTGVEIEVAIVPPSGDEAAADVVRLRGHAPASPFDPSPLTRIAAAGTQLAERLVPFVRAPR